MTTYYESELSNNQTIEFQSDTDLFVFENPSLPAASLGVSFDEYYSMLSISVGPKTFILSGNALQYLDARNMRFADGSVLVLSENFALAAGSFAFMGSWGSDQLIGNNSANLMFGGDGNDRIDGRAGADTMNGGLGADTYIVDSLGDIVLEAPTMTPEFLSTSQNGVGLSSAFNGTISEDGKYLVFVSQSAVFAPNPSYSSQIYRKNLQTGDIELISSSTSGTIGNGWSERPSISADGRYIAFYSSANDLIDGDTNSYADIFVKDMETGTMSRISTDASGVQAVDGNSYSPRISPDGQYVIFQSFAGNLVESDTNSAVDIFIKDLVTGSISLLSTTSEGLLGEKSSYAPDFSADGRYVVFSSESALVQSDTNLTSDIYLKDRNTNSTIRLSESDQGVQADAGSFKPRITSDGRYVVFESYATNLVEGDVNLKSDVFLKDLETGSLLCVSQSEQGVLGNGDSSESAISADGEYVVFTSFATNLVEDAISNLFVLEVATGEIRSLDAGGSGGEPLFSPDGSNIYFRGVSEMTPNQPSGNQGIIRVSNPFLLVDDGARDTVRASVSFKLPNKIENLILTGSDDINGAGNALDNHLIGNAGSNQLTGGLGSDTLNGGSGIDTVSYATSTQAVIANLAKPALNSKDAKGDVYVSIENLVGTKYDDQLSGNRNSNMIYGAAGDDILLGGSGKDQFIYKSAGDSSAPRHHDVILDFENSDRIVLLDIDAKVNIAGNQAFSFIGGKAFTGHAGDLRYTMSNHSTIIYGDTNGDKQSDFTLELDDSFRLSANHFML